MLGEGASSRIAAALLSRLLKIAGIRRSVAMRNFGIVFPESAEAERRALVDQTYEHMVWTGIELLVLQRDPSRVLEWFDVENADFLDELARDGAILLTGHVGNWEITAAWVAQRGHKITAIVRESDDEDERGAIGSLRARVGVSSLAKTAPMTRSIGILKRGEFLGILPDQHGGGEGIAVPFFGVPTSTSKGAAVFAHLTKKPLVPFYSHRVAPFRHALRIGPAIEWTPMATRDETIFDITKKINEAVETMVREAPGQWLAEHRRFRELEAR